jgi:hypothetical protein
MWGVAPHPTLRGLKPFLRKGFKNPKNFWKMDWAEFLAVLFYMNGTRVHVGPLPHRIEQKVS